MTKQEIPGARATDRESSLGRPPLPSDQVRSQRVVSFVTRGELDALNELAEARGESLSSAIHRILRSALTKQTTEESVDKRDT